MELGLLLGNVRFRRYGRYVVAIVVAAPGEEEEPVETGGQLDLRGGSSLAFVSEEAAPSRTPQWQELTGGGVRLPAGAMSVPVVVRILFYLDDALASDRQSLISRSRPLCSCSFPVRPHQEAVEALFKSWFVPLLREGDTAGCWEEEGTVQLRLCPLQDGRQLAKLVPVQELYDGRGVVPAASRFPPHEQFARLRAMAQRQTAEVEKLLHELSRLQMALERMESHRDTLRGRFSQLVADATRCEGRLLELTEPALSDLDMELLLSLPGGIAKAAAMLHGTEERYRRTRATLLMNFSELKQARQEADGVVGLHNRLQDLRAVHREQAEVVRRAQAKCQEAAKYREVAMQQKRLVDALKARLAESQHRGGPPAGCHVQAELALSKEQNERDALVEAATQLELLVLRDDASAANTKKEVQLVERLRDGAERVQNLLVSLEKLQRNPRLKGVQEARTVDMEALLLSQIQDLQTEHDDLIRRGDMLERQGQQQAVQFAQQLASLKTSLAEREAQGMALARRLPCGWH
eukprot:TRINITY_DN25544_c0_g1_i3.p1 TRINITY_DN25544_c0_g1~~TRINITY_DN25544_c0_g1_i3.p1  ORF type:complete len:522 (+),score=119.45 TRINITY_DN25544_c0_g1_i3:197-1762(+)